MGLERYFLHDFFTAREFNHIERSLGTRLRRIGRAERRASARAEELEAGLGRVALLARALAELCLAKGILTRAELAAMMERLDLGDGAPDGRLDPRAAHPGEETRPAPAPVRRVRPPTRRRR